MHKWHDRGSGGKIPQKGRFSPILDGVEGDESWEEGLEDEGPRKATMIP